MFRAAQTLGGILILAGATVLVTPSFGQAQAHGGGGHFGGGHISGPHISGGHIGGIHPGGAHIGPAHIGGAHVGTYQRGSYHHNGYRSGRPFTHYEYGYRRPELGYYGAYYPYYGLYDSYPYDDYYGDYYDNPNAWLDPTVAPSYADVSGYLGGANPAASSQTDTFPSATPAQVTVKVPADAEVWFDGVQMTTPGTVRTYKSPPLAPGHYNYDVRARWNENGHEVTQTQQVVVSPGAGVEVDFPQRSGAVAMTPATPER